MENYETVGTLRRQVAQLGIIPNGQDRYELLAILAKHNEETEDMRRECARRGLPTDGDRKALELRLEMNSSNSLQTKHKQLWYYAGIASCVLGCLVLAISIPHVTDALQRLTGMTWLFALLFAIVVDFGICALKIIDTLSYKFHLTRKTSAWVNIGMIICLLMSAALNATEFMRHAATMDDKIVSILLAVFISGFVFLFFYVGSAMLLECKPRQDEEMSQADKMRHYAKELDRLSAIADKL